MPPLDPLLFFGTPEFAVPTLQALVEAGRVPARVVTQPGRPAGRGQALVEPPVARWAREHGLAVVQ
ncbi:MAG TPA: methionyl-tRNA formyltransferase, partial [Thermoanaerobaculia bacterium]